MKNLKNLTSPLLSLDGEPILENGKPLTAAFLIATMISRAVSDDPVRAIKVAQEVRFALEEGVQIDDADYDLIYDAVKRDQGYNNLVKAHCLAVLQDA